MEMTATIVGPQDGKAGHLGGIGVRFMAWAAETGGGFSLVEHPMEPRALAAPLHRHANEDEYSYVLVDLRERPTPEAVEEIAARYGLEFDMASIPALCERHGLRFPM